MNAPRRMLPLALLIAALSMTGCGSSGDRPELGTVTGNVTMDGEPLSGVIILFKPDTGRPASDTTDEKGNYELVYRHGVRGSKIGPTTVSFEWPLGMAGKPIPDDFGARSTQKVDVQPGENSFDFNIISKPDQKSVPQAD